MPNCSDYLYPQSAYYGEDNPINNQFNSDLQLFSQQVNFICALENNGKLTPQQAYEQIEDLWESFEPSGNQFSPQ